MADIPTLDDLLTHYQPADGEPFSSDPAQLSDRLARKLAITPSKFDEIDFTPKTKEAKKPDLSSLGEPVAEPSSDDLSSFGDEVKPATAEQPTSSPGVLATFGKGLAHGAPEQAGSILQGTAALTHTKAISPEGVGLIDELGNAATMTAGERAKLMGRALRTIGDRGAQMDFNAALQRIARGGDAGSEAQALRDKFGIQNQKAAAPIEQDPLYKAGKATKDWIDKTVPMTDEEKSSIAGRTGSGISGMVPYLAAGIIAGPEVGLVLGAAGMGASTAGDTFVQAKAKGASDEKAATAAGWGGAIGAAMGVLPLGMVLKPVSAASDTWKSLLAAKLVQAGQSGITFSTVGEAQEYLLQQVAKEQYDPQAGYSPDAKRVIAGLLTGGVLGTMHPLSPKPSDLSSPESIADFLRRASGRTGADDGSTGGGTARGAAWRSEIDDFIREKDAREAAAAPGLPKPEGGEPGDAEAGTGAPPETPKGPSGGAATEQTEIEALKRYGWSDDEIAGMTPEQRRAEFQDAMATGRSEPKAATSGSDAGAAADKAMEGLTDMFGGKGGTAPLDGETGPVPGSRDETSLRAELESLRGANSPLFDQREQARATGDEAKVAQLTAQMQANDARNTELRELLGIKTKVSRLTNTTGFFDDEPAAGTRSEPIQATTQQDVLDAQPAEPKSQAQAEAENYKHAHLEIEHLGLVGRHSISIETGVGQTRNGPDGEDGKPQWTIPSMPVAYGRIKGTRGADGQPLDIFVGPVPTSAHVFVIDQHHNEGGFDEHKIMAGFPGPDAALRAYADSYADKGGNRIGHVTAYTPEQFQDWLSNGDTTQPLKKSLSEQEIGNLFDDIVGTGEKSGEPEAATNDEEGSPQLPQDASDGGRSPRPAGAVKPSGTIEPKNGEVIAPGRLYAEPTEEFHAQIEAVLGADYHHVMPVDVARATEILAANPQLTPHLAFQYAVIENAFDQGFLPRTVLERIYGPQVKPLLVAGGESASGGSEPAQQNGTQPDQEPTRGGEETGVVPGSGETGTPAPEPEREGPTKGGDGEQHDTTGEQPNPRRKARGRADEKGAGTTKDADDAGRLIRTEEQRAAIEKEFPAGWHIEWSGTTDKKGKNWTPNIGGARLFIQGPNRAHLEAGGIENTDQAISEAKRRAREAADKIEPFFYRGTEGFVEKPKIEDAGEKLGGARKDKWAGAGITSGDLADMSEADKAKSVIKANVWPRPDYAAAVDDGVDPKAAALVKLLYDRLPTKPLTTYSRRDAADDYVAVLNKAREVLGEVKTIDDVRAANDKIERGLGKDSYYQLGSIFLRDRNPFYVTGMLLGRADRLVAEGFPNTEPWQRLFTIRKSTFHADVPEANIKRGDVRFVVERKNGASVGEFGTREAAEAEAKKAYDALGEERKKGGQEPIRPHLDNIERSGPDYRRGKNVTGEDFVKDFGFRGVEFGNWVAGDERQKTVNLAYDAFHDLARVIGITPKALSLNGTLGLAFGARGRGGKAAAHYESDALAINMTKLSGAGTLAHEWAHALDDYLAMAHGASPAVGLSGWRVPPKNPKSHWNAAKFSWENKQFPPKLRTAANKLMHDLFNVEESDDQAIARIEDRIKQHRSGQAGWVARINELREQVRKGGSRAGLTQAERQAEVWNDHLKGYERQLENGIPRHAVPSSYLREATKLSGTTGDYWRRPNEMFARAFEAYVFDKIAGEGFTSQYLVQGVEGDRYTGTGFRGNPYPVGAERTTITKDFDRLLRALEATEGKHGIASRLVGAKGEPEPIEESTKVLKPQPQPAPGAEHQALDAASKPATLDQAFYEHFIAGRGFEGIIPARKFAKDAGFDDNPKSIEEAMEFAIVKTARWLVDAEAEPSHTYDALVKLYGKQPRLGTRTSTSVRDQAYSTPVPLGYLAQRLAGVTQTSTVFEPTAGNGALLTAANPREVYANEINPQRAKNLREQGYFTGENDASAKVDKVGPYDVVLANPPFGPVRENDQSRVFDMSDIQPGYKTTEIDHVIALRALAAMKDDGRAVLILGGLNKQVTTREGRSDGYNGKAKREFYLSLYKNYNVTDHFTVAGELYERQGAAWPVDVIVINGRGKSAKALPAVDVPRIYDSWEALGGLIHGQGDGEHAAAVERPAGGAVEEQPGLGGSGRPNRGGSGRGRPAGPGRQGESNPVRDEPVRGQPEAGGAGRTGDQEQGGSVQDRPANGSGEQPAAERPSPRLSADEIGDIFDDLVGEKRDGRSSPLDHEVIHEPSGTVVHAAVTKADAEAFAKDSGKGFTARYRHVPPGLRTTPEVAKSAAKNAASAADEALSGLTELFGGGKTIGSGLNFDEETYKKARPMFEAAAEKFAAFKYDIRELMRRMIDHLKDAYKWTTEHLKNARPYMVRFIQDVQEGVVNLNKAPEPEAKPAERPVSKAVETAGQAVYVPQSKTPGLDTLVPVNMKRSISDALAALEAKVGPIDTFVAKELGYDKADLEKYFGAEQVDALGLAIDNLNKGRGFIIGDQTGIGKGRVNAAIIKWALRKGRIPVFTTMMPDLYADMVRDMTDIGMPVPRILATNTGLSMPLDDEGKNWIRTGDAKAHSGLMMALHDPEVFKKKYDVVFATYHQMQTVKGENTERRKFLSGIIPTSTILFDESHNAGGQVKERKQKGTALDRSEFARDLVNRANGVFYSSATYAKRPDVMSLYSATDMAMAVDDINSLGEAISKGGIPMQQAVAAMLAKGGQYIRRERSFDGINYNTPQVKVDHDTYDQISRSLAAIQDFSAQVKEVVRDISAQLKAEGEAIGADNAVSDAGASSTNFTSIMHNIINQMLLAMKVPEASKMAIQHIRDGQKVVLTVANTMEAFLKDYTNELDIKPGDEIEADFSDVLMKYLDRSRRITIRKPFGKEKEYKVLTDDELGPLALDAYNNAKAMIAAMDLSHLPISPIDHLKSELQKAGYDVGEITGRGLMIDYSGETPVLRTRPGGETTTKGKNATRNKFNTRPSNGGSHAIVINQSGSTGVSMHANVKFDDRSKRRMMIVQPEANIDTHMQLLGRINRTGQVVLPEYDQLVADIPAEKRPASVLAKKMASLNANTTASRTSAVTAKDVPDFMNQYGDTVAANYLSDNFDVNERLAWPVSPSEGGKIKPDDAMRKLTGRIPLLPLAEQEALYDHLEEEYAALIKQIEASGASPLEAKTFDLKARTLETTEVQGQKNGSGSPFAAPVNVEKVSVLRQGKPFKPREVLEQLRERLGLDETFGASDDIEKLWKDLTHIGNTRAAEKIEQTERTDRINAFNAYSRPLIEKIEDIKEQEAERNKFNAIKDRWTSLHTLLPIGKRIRLNMFDSNPVAVVLDVKQTGKAKNPLALSSWKVNFAVADASRQMVLPFSRLYLQGQADSESMLDVEVVPTNETPRDTLARFEMMQSGAREERHIATGNLLAAYDWLNMKGAIINYTDAQGAVHQGIMIAKGFNLGKHAIAKGRLVSDPAEIKALLDQNQTLWSKDRQVNLSRADRWSDNYQIQAEKKKATGGRYYLDKELTDLTGDFSSRGGMMTATVPGKDLGRAIERMQKIGAQFSVAAAAPQATKIEQPPEGPDDDEPSPGGGTVASLREAAPNRLTVEAARLRGEIEQKLRDIVRQVAGPGVKVEFPSGLMEVGESPGYHPEASSKAAGTYTLAQSLIRLAFLPGHADLMATSAFHESYHHVESRLQNEQERRLMEQETPRLREWIKGKVGITETQVDQLAGFEVRAIAFQLYARDRGAAKPQAGAGIHIMMRRWFDRLMEGLRALGHALRGLGFKTYHDIFNEAFTGKFAGRTPSEGPNLNPDSMSALADLFRRSDAAVTGRLRDVMNATMVGDRIKEKVQNLNEGVKRLEDAVQARMEGELPDSKAFYQKKRLFPGKVAAEVQDFNKQHLDPLVDTLRNRGLTLDQVGDILYAQHAEERNAYIDTINPDAAGMGSGMSNDEAQAILDRYSPADLAEIAHRIDGIRDFILATMEHAGLESPATTAAWRAQYQHYVPLGGFEERDPNRDDETFRESGKFNVRGREVKRAFGRTSKADNPLINIIDQAYRTIERAKKNEYLRSLQLALRSLEPDQLKGFVQFDRGKPRREIDPRTGLVRFVDDSSYRFSPKAVAYKVGGNTRYMVFDKHSVAEVLRRMHPDALNGVGQAMLNFQNKLKASWTHWSPEFLLRHFIFRYPIEGTLNSFEQGASNVPRYMADAMPFLGRASKAIFASNSGMVHPDPETAQYQRYWQEMREAGGSMAFRQARDVDLLRDHLKKKLASLSGRPLASVRDKFRAGVEAVDTITNALDNSLRLAAYATARRQGKTPEQAAIIARDATVDYQMAGQWKNLLGLIWPFGNVATQTGARMGSAVTRSKMMRRVFGASIAAGFLSGMFNYLVGGDDTDGVPFFDKIPWWQKQLHLTVLNPFHKDAKGRPVPIHIPLPYNWAWPFTIGQMFATMAFSKTRGEVRHAIGAAVKSGVAAFSAFAEDENQVANVMPELLKTPTHTYTNENWTGYHVHIDPDHQKGPRSESGFKATGEGWKYSTRMLNAMSGGDRHHAGYVDMFPEDLRELWDYYSGTGTQRKFVANAATTVSNATSGKPTDYSKIPMARVFMGTDYDAANRARKQEHSRLDRRPWER